MIADLSILLNTLQQITILITFNPLTATKINEEKYSRLKEHRENELKLNKQLYQ